MTSEDYDLVILGAGLAGATLACGLANSPLRVLLVDREPPPAPVPTGTTIDLRVSAIHAGCERAFRALGVWQHLPTQRMAPFRGLRVWEGDGDEVHYDSAAIGEPALGHIMENRALIAACHSRLQAAPNLAWLVGGTALRILDEKKTPGVRLLLAEGQELRAGLVVAADGADSFVRGQAGIATRQKNYRQSAVIAVVESERHHEFIAWQRFLPSGPLALLPLPGNEAAIIWSTDNAAARRLCDLPDVNFVEELATAFGHRFGKFSLRSGRTGLPLRALTAGRYFNGRSVLVGDAAHVVHPLAGLGANLAIADALALAQLLTSAAEQHKAIDDVALLRRYERWRRSENQPVAHVIDGLNRLFMTHSRPVTGIRRLGLRLIDRAPPVKNWLMEHASGVRGDLPRLMASANY